MPIIKRYDISKIEEVKRISSLVEEIQEKNQYSDYNPEKIMLVRTTNIFPENREIKPLAKASFIAKSRMNFICNTLYNELDSHLLKQLETYELYYRSTIHFAENGLVSSHMYGNFNNQLFIILEPLINQLDKSNFRNFAGQDTFIQGSVTLSENAIIIIKEENYKDIQNNYPEIDHYNIVLYKGIDNETKKQYIKENEFNMPDFDVNDERAIVELVLIDLGYTPELIGTHYIINSKTSNKIRNVNETLADKYNVLAEAKHIHTDEYKEDFNKNLMITEIFNKMLLDFIIKINNIEMPITLDNDTAYLLIELIGIDNLIDSINKFNQVIEEMNEHKLLPTSEELLNGNIPNLIDYYTNLSPAIK